MSFIGPSLVFRSSRFGAFFAGAALLGALGLTAMLWISAPARSERLSLTIEDEGDIPGCYFGSRFNDGDILVSGLDISRPIVWQTEFDFSDGCRWQSTETLTPQGYGYGYSYSERPISCNGRRWPAPACTRAGRVLVTPID
jgi:hypothetical protein